MSDERYFLRIDSIQKGRNQLGSLWDWCKLRIAEGHRLEVTCRKATRSVSQNSILWSILTDLERQVDWPIDGRLQKLTAEEWKEILSAGLKKEQRVAAGLSGGFVMLGSRTSKMTVAELSELIELAYAFGAERNVNWSRTSLGREVPDEAMQ